MDSFVDAMVDKAAMEETKDDANSPATDSAQHILAFVLFLFGLWP
jgi:hypothetical protein